MAKDTMLSAVRKQAQQALDASPSPKQCQLVVACMAGIELIPETEDEWAKIVEKAAKFYAFISTDFRMAKRDLPRLLVQKIDKAVQDRHCFLGSFNCAAWNIVQTKSLIEALNLT